MKKIVGNAYSRSYFQGYRIATILGKCIPFLCQTNLSSLSLSLRSPLLSPIRCRALRARSRARIECSRGEENTGGRIFTSLGYSSLLLLLPRRQIDFHRDRDCEGCGTGQSKTWPQGVRGFLVSRRRLRRRRRVSRASPWTSPRLFVHVGSRDIPPILFAYVRVYIYMCVYVHRPLRTGYVALMYHLRRWTRIYICIYSVCMESMYRRARAYPWVYASVKARPVPPVSVARVCYARPGMFPTKLTSPRLDALAMPAQSGIESFPSVAVTA